MRCAGLPNSANPAQPLVIRSARARSGLHSATLHGWGPWLTATASRASSASLHGRRHYSAFLRPLLLVSPPCRLAQSALDRRLVPRLQLKDQRLPACATTGSLLLVPVQSPASSISYRYHRRRIRSSVASISQHAPAASKQASPISHRVKGLQTAFCLASYFSTHGSRSPAPDQTATRPRTRPPLHF